MAGRRATAAILAVVLMALVAMSVTLAVYSYTSSKIREAPPSAELKWASIEGPASSPALRVAVRNPESLPIRVRLETRYGVAGPVILEPGNETILAIQLPPGTLVVPFTLVVSSGAGETSIGGSAVWRPG